MSEAYVPNLQGRVGTRLTIAVIGTLAGLGSMFLVIGLMALDNREHAPIKSTVTTLPEKVQALQDLQAQDEATLISYGKDPVTGAERLPIDVAMEKVVAEYQRK